MTQIDRTKIEKGMFLTSGPPVSGAHLTKVYAANAEPTIDETDEKFDEAARLQALLAKTKAAIDALKSRN
jgi:hypothetical protein